MYIMIHDDTLTCGSYEKCSAQGMRLNVNVATHINQVPSKIGTDDFVRTQFTRVYKHEKDTLTAVALVFKE